MPVSSTASPAPTALDRLRTELADLAFALERQGRRDAADVVMQIDVRVRELAGGGDALVAAGLAGAGATFVEKADGRPGSPTPATAG